MLASFQYGVTTTDPLSWLVVVGVIFAATLLASWRPALTACRADPAEMLRQE